MLTAFSLRFRSLYKKIGRSSNFVVQVIMTMAANLLLASLGLISGILAARLLGSTGRGELAAIQTWPMFIALIAMLGVPDALVYYSAREPERAARWLTTAICVALLSCLPFAALGYLLIPWVLGVQTDEVISASRGYLWMLPIYATTGMLQHPLRGRGDLFAWNVVRMLTSIAWVAVLIFNMLLSIDNPFSVAQNYLMVMALLVVPMSIVVKLRLPGSFVPSRQAVQPLLRYGLPLALSALPSFLNLRVDQMLMAGVLGPQLLGLYVVGVSWSNVVLPLINALQSVVLPSVAGAQQENQVQLLTQATRIGLLLSLLLATLGALATPLVVPLLFGTEYVPAIPATIILCLAAGVSGFSGVLEAGALGLGMPNSVLITQVIGLAATAILLWLLLPSFQLIGAAIASIISYSISTIALAWLICQKSNLHILEFLVIKTSDVNVFFLQWRMLKERVFAIIRN